MVRSRYQRSKHIAILAVLCLACGTFALAQAPKTGTLKVEITGIRNAEGNIRVALRSDENTIAAAKIVEIDPKTLTAEAVFDNLAEGCYGVAVFHDENKNENLDFGENGVPLEGYGHSNNPAKRPGPPDFSETKFAFAAPTQTVEIKLVYWQ
jgi:uncharacterized protein (DUF2141 family)